MRATALLVEAADPDGPVEAGPLQTPKGLLSGFDALQTFIGHCFPLAVVTQLYQDRVALPRQQVSYLFVVDFYHADSDSLISYKCLSVIKPLEDFIHRIVIDSILGTAYHSVRLARSCLTVRHNTDVKAVQARGNKMMHFLIDGRLSV